MDNTEKLAKRKPSTMFDSTVKQLAYEKFDEACRTQSPEKRNKLISEAVKWQSKLYDDFIDFGECILEETARIEFRYNTKLT